MRGSGQEDVGGIEGVESDGGDAASLVAVLLACGTVLLVGIAPVVAAGPARAVPAETGRYNVVGPPVDGQREHLSVIALRTLGNGNRAALPAVLPLVLGHRGPWRLHVDLGQEPLPQPVGTGVPLRHRGDAAAHRAAGVPAVGAPGRRPAGQADRTVRSACPAG
ncbi:hypothetical protein ACQP1S_14480 [Micromonospora matsumotoense]|uniref:hypothetical protein n=1 Tax=Micromonospora matsumotoense TaxID=121616 RepID=UPI003D8A80EB